MNLDISQNSSVTLNQLAFVNAIDIKQIELFNSRQLILLAGKKLQSNKMIKTLEVLIWGAPQSSSMYSQYLTKSLAEILEKDGSWPSADLQSFLQEWFLTRNDDVLESYIRTSNLMDVASFTNIDVNDLFKLEIFNIIQAIQVKLVKSQFVHLRSQLWDRICVTQIDDLDTKMNALATGCGDISMTASPALYGVSSSSVNVTPNFSIKDITSILQEIRVPGDLDMRSVMMLLDTKLISLNDETPLVVYAFRKGIRYAHLSELKLIDIVKTFLLNSTTNAIAYYFGLPGQESLLEIQFKDMLLSGSLNVVNKLNELSISGIIKVRADMLSSTEITNIFIDNIRMIADNFTVKELEQMYDISRITLLSETNLITLSALVFKTNLTEFVRIFGLTESQLAAINQTNIQTLANLVEKTHSLSWETRTFSWLMSYLFSYSRETLLLLSPMQIFLMSGKPLSPFVSIGNTIDGYLPGGLTAIDFESLVVEKMVPRYIVPMSVIASLSRTMLYADIASNSKIPVNQVHTTSLQEIVREVEKGN